MIRSQFARAEYIVARLSNFMYPKYWVQITHNALPPYCFSVWLFSVSPFPPFLLFHIGGTLSPVALLQTWDWKGCLYENFVLKFCCDWNRAILTISRHRVPVISGLKTIVTKSKSYRPILQSLKIAGYSFLIHQWTVSRSLLFIRHGGIIVVLSDYDCLTTSQVGYSSSWSMW